GDRIFIEPFGLRFLRPCTHKSRLVSSGWSMSALPPKADIRQRIEHVCFVPIADIAQQAVVVALRQFTTYKVLGFRWSLLGAVMHGSLLLQLLILLVVANGTAVGAKKLLGAAFWPPARRRRSLCRWPTHIRALENHPRHRGVRVGDVHLRGA